MAKVSCKIGFVSTKKTEPGVWEPVATERTYYGELTKVYHRFVSSGSVNDNVTLNHTLSIIADPFAKENFYSIQYVELWGAKWKVTNVEMAHPRLNLSLGDVYNQ